MYFEHSAEDGLRLKSVFPSDALATMTKIVNSMPALHPLLTKNIRLYLVLDANVVQEEIRWRSKRREKPTARTALHELIDAGVVVPLVPTFLDSEIEEHLLELSNEIHVSIEEVQRHWHDFRTQLIFYTPQQMRDQTAAVIDPDDVQYKRTCEELGADAVYSRDPHLQKMNVRVISSMSLASFLREHARNRSVSLGVELGSGAMLVIGIESLSGLYRLANKAIAGFCRLPSWAQLGVGAVAFAILAHPECRAKLAETWDDISNTAIEMRPGALTILEEVSRQYFKAKQITTQTHAAIRLELPRTPRRSALQYVRLICLADKMPLSILEIAQRIRKEGYVSQSRNFARYLQRIMRESKQFAEVSQGMWLLKSA